MQENMLVLFCDGLTKSPDINQLYILFLCEVYLTS